MYLETIVLTRTVPCLAEPSKIIVFGKPSRSLDDVLPYLATLPNVISYNPKGGSLTLRREPGFITLLVDQVYITKVRDVEEGIVLLSHLVDAINATWEHRQELVAATAAHRAPRMLDIWSLLPHKPIAKAAVKQRAWHLRLRCCNIAGHPKNAHYWHPIPPLRNNEQPWRQSYDP